SFFPRASYPKSTLPSTERQAKSDLLNSWNTRTRFGGGPLIACPFTTISPVVEAVSPAMDMSKVVLPQPEGPTKETNSPASTWQEIAACATVVSQPIWR